ncbi:MAG: FAD-dependent oxidoreductase [Oligoflexus sp.]
MIAAKDLLPGQIEDITAVGRKYILLQLKMPAPYSQNPGQYCFLQLSDAQGAFQKPYSIASEPRSDGLVEFCLLNDGDQRTQAALSAFKLGDEVLISPAKGRFHWPRAATPAVFVAGGSGIAPLRSMLRFRFSPSAGDFAPSKLYYGCDDFDQIPYFNEFQELAAKHHEFQVKFFIPKKSTAIADIMVHEGFPTLGLKGRFASNTEFFLCGPPPMMMASKETLHSQGIKGEKIFTDQY